MQTVVAQLTDQARTLTGIAEELRRGEHLQAVVALAEDRSVWSGAPQRVFCGWLGALDGWVRNQLAGGVAGVAERVEAHARNLEDAQRKVAAGVPGVGCPAPPRPVGYVPGRPPDFAMRLPVRAGPVRMASDAMRHLAKLLGEAKDALLATGRRVDGALVPPAITPPAPGAMAVDVAAGLPPAAHLPPDARDAVGWPAAWLALAEELDRAIQDVLARADRWARAAPAEANGDDAIRSVMAFLSSTSGLLGRPRPADAGAAPAPPPTAPLSTAGLSVRPSDTKEPTERDRRKQGGSDARRVLDALESGFFNLPEPEKARKILARGVETARTDPAYSAGFLNKLGPKGLAKLLDDPSMGPCVVGELVARASLATRPDGQPEFGERFLKKTLGKNKGKAARRAAILGACECPGAAFHPAWTGRLIEVLYRGPDVSTRGDSRVWFRECADRLITQLDSGTPPGPPPGFEAETIDAVEGLIGFAADHHLNAAGRVALAGLLAQPDMMMRIGDRFALGGDAADPNEPGFNVDQTDLRKVLAELGTDPACGPRLVGAAEEAAKRRLPPTAARFVNDPGDPFARDALRALGATLGALTAEDYPDSAVAIDAMKASAETVKGLVASLAGVALKATGAGYLATLVVDGAQTISFALGSAELDAERANDKLEDAADGKERRDRLRETLDTDMEYLAYVSLLADPAGRASLGVRLDAGAFPAELPRNPTTGRLDSLLVTAGVKSVQAWRDLLFEPPDHHLVVPDPRDVPRYAAFQAWVRYANPKLAATAGAMHDTMKDAFNDQLITSV